MTYVWCYTVYSLSVSVKSKAWFSVHISCLSQSTDGQWKVGGRSDSDSLVFKVCGYMTCTMYTYIPTSWMHTHVRAYLHHTSVLCMWESEVTCVVLLVDTGNE